MTAFANRLTSIATFQSALNAAEYCAVNKGAKLIDDAEVGCCSPSQKDVQKMLNLIDAVRCIVPEGALLSGTQASVSITFTKATINRPFAINVEEPGGTPTLAVYTMTSPSSTISVFVTYAAAFINAMYPQNYPFTATADGNVLTLYGSTYELDNLRQLSYTWQAADFTFSSTSIFAGGIAAVYQGQNAITNNDLQIILSKLCSLCKN
jgi:hypothetical protein